MENEKDAHIREERLEAYSANLLAGDELDRTEEHLLVCETCQDRLNAVERFGRAMRSAAMRIREEEKQAPKTSGMGQWLRRLFHLPLPVWAGAAAVSVALLVIFSVSLRHPTHTPQPLAPGPPVEVALEAIRGESTGTAPAGHALHLLLDGQGVAEIPVWQVEIVDSEGGKIWNGKGIRSDSTIIADVPLALSPGTYYIRLINDSPVDPAREFELVVK
jgi:hypothetical protein